MSDEVYRGGYRVELRVREPTREESARLESELRRWNTEVVRLHEKRMREAMVPLAVGAIMLVGGLIKHNVGFVIASGAVTVFVAILTIVARRKSLALVAASRGPWHPPEGGWKVREASVRARSIIVAASDDEDYMTWLLFEVPGGDWFYTDAAALKPELARAEIRITRLWPNGPYLHVDASGDAISHDDWSREAYAAALDAGRVWRPKEDADWEDVVAEASLPAWARERS